MLIPLLIVTPIVDFCNCSLYCCTLLNVHSSFAIILMRQKELAALLGLLSDVSRLLYGSSSRCHWFVCSL